MRTPIAFALLFSLLADAAPRHMPRPEDQIKIRQGSDLFMSWNMDRIGDLLAEPPPGFSREAVVKAAQAIAAVANAGVHSLYGPGSEKSVGDIKTRVKLELFQQPERVRDLSANLASEANELVRVAAAGEPAAIRRQLAKTGEACKACHDAFRSKAAGRE